MRILRRIYRVIALFLWGSWHGIYCLPIRYLYEVEHSIRRMALQTKYWGGGIVKILGIRTIIHGDPSEYRKTGGLVVANHQSYVDIFLHASIFGLRFTPKKEIKSWPVLGWYTDMIRPIWVDRDSKQSAANLMEQFRDTLRKKIPLIVYPEGTTSDGQHGLKEFKTTPFETVCGTDIPIQPMISIYRVQEGDMHPAWYGDATFMPHHRRCLHPPAHLPGGPEPQTAGEGGPRRHAEGLLRAYRLGPPCPGGTARRAGNKNTGDRP